MGKNEAEAILSSTRKNLGHRGRDEVVELINVEEEWTTLVGLGALSTQGGSVKSRDKERAQKVCVLLPDRPLGYAAEEYLP